MIELLAHGGAIDPLSFAIGLACGLAYVLVLSGGRSSYGRGGRNGPPPADKTAKPSLPPPPPKPPRR